MKIAVAFGKDELTLRLPDGPRYEVIRAQSARPLARAAQALEAALDAPLGCAPLVELARRGGSAAISVCDITRPAPNAFTLPAVLERLHRAGMGREDVTILIATGLHRAATAEELNLILGAEIAATYRVVNHDARDLAAHRRLGSTRRQTPVSIDERFLAADLHITLGLIEPHLMLGYSGGRKLIAPGLAAEPTIKRIHSPGFMRDPLATEGSIRENPLHAELLEIARMARHDFMVDVTLTPAREISGIFAGAPEQAHAAGVAFWGATSTVELEERVDAAITSAAGYPLDLTFYQTIKGITAAEHLVKPGGKILVLAECREGIGSPEFAAMLRRYAGAREYLDRIEGAPVDVDQWQLEKLALVEQKHALLLYTPNVAKQDLGSLAASSYDTPERAIEALFGGLAEDARVAVIPEGPYAFARVAREQRRAL
ncbi:MAG: nickel-dependent lactate racemase [Acidobacteriota bacterium]